MATAPYYIFTPCCGGGHPISLKITDEFGNIVVFDDLLPVYQYLGAPYPDTTPTGPFYLETNQCYYVQEALGSAIVVVDFNDCPAAVNFNQTMHSTCYAAKISGECSGCLDVYEFVSCCTGESTIYNVTGIKLGDIVSGSTYLVALDVLDLTTVSCYSITETTVPNPELLPTIDIANIEGGPVGEGCNDFTCFLLCQECRCEEFSGTSGIYQVFDCDLTLAQIVGTVDGPVISYDGVTYEPLTESLCLRYWFQQTIGLTKIDKGLCDIVYWNETGIEANCPIYYKIVNCLDENEYYCVSNDLSTEYSTNTVLTVNGETFANKCWRIEETSPCPQTITISFTITHEDCADCLDKLATYYELINCNDGNVIVYTSTNLQPYVGSYITLDEYPEDCWFVEALSTNTPSEPIPVNVNQPFISCELCSGPQYLLEDCDIDNPDPNIITNTDLSAYLTPPGQVITLLNCPDKCWIVSETDPIPTPQLVNVTADYAGCETCQLALLPCVCTTAVNNNPGIAALRYVNCEGIVTSTPLLAIGERSAKVCAQYWVTGADQLFYGDCIDNVCPASTLIYKSIRPGYDTPGCEPDKFERIICNFSEATYRQIMVDAYGITPCCGEDDIQYEIRYELIKLKAIQDPDFNCSTVSTCDCTTSAPGLSQQNCNTGLG